MDTTEQTDKQVSKRSENVYYEDKDTKGHNYTKGHNGLLS